MPPSLAPILLGLEYFVYATLVGLALYGAFLGILLVRRVTQKKFASQSSAEQFMEEIHQLVSRQDFDGITQLCDSPPYWAKAVPQLILVALANRQQPIKKIRHIVAEKFEREILAELEYALAWVATCVRTGPMLGLMGTVLGIIISFSKLSEMAGTGGDASQLAGGIGTALFATALGLTVAIPLTLLGAVFHVRIGRLQSEVQLYMTEFLDDLDFIKSRGKT